MNKTKKVFVPMLLCLLLTLSLAAQKNDISRKSSDSEVVTKTYELKNVSPDSIDKIISPYILTIGKERGSQIMVVTLPQYHVKAFEALLARLDQPKKSISFRVFTVIASNRADVKAAEVHPDLEQVLGEMRSVLGYKKYELDGVSTLMVSEGSKWNEVILNSRFDDLVLKLGNVSLSLAEDGKSVLVGSSLQLREKFGGIIVDRDRQVVDRDLLGVEKMQLREGGYLVAGVSRMGKEGDALVLVINATVL